VLFCDLAGLTAASEAADPEDVRSASAPTTLSSGTKSSSTGRTVEKFIGDAVLAAFGAPVAHEDDAERAVRARLRVLEAIEVLNADDATLEGIANGCANSWRRRARIC
jgi:class 3 adenylate cyclase